MTSLPVARDQIIVRFNANTALSTKQQNSFQFPISVGYGLTSNWGLFASLSQGFVSTDAVGLAGPTRVSNGGSGDLGLYARYTLYKHDTPNATFRIAPLAGAFVPSGGNDFRFEGRLQGKSLQTGSGTADPYFGVSAGYSAKRWTANADATYRWNPLTKTNFSPGSELRLDGQFEFKFYPRHMPEEGLPHLMNLSIESNYYQNAFDHLGGVLSANSGGKTFRQNAIVQLSSLRWQTGAGMQVPLMQELYGTGRTRLKVGYLVFFEYYLSAPVWRRKG